MADIQKLQAITSQVRRDIIRMVNAVNSGHPGGSLGCAELFVALYNEVMDYDPANFKMDGKMKICSFYLKVIFHLFGIVFWHIQDIFLRMS